MGVEVDGSWSNIMPRMTFPALVGTDAIHTYSTFDYLATARVRLGLAAGPWLFYGTGGGAWMHSSSDITLTNGVGPNWGPILARGESSADHLGWVAGLGLEYAVSNHWIAHIEYLHYDFGTETYTYSTLGTVTSAAATIESARMAIAYKF
jgi:opacity protein-like surface antigen